MSKAMLIMDMPESCEECQFFARFDFVKNCSLNRKQVEYPKNKKSRMDWCPLRELPEKKEPIPFENDDYYRSYNDCIDDILGG